MKKLLFRRGPAGVNIIVGDLRLVGGSVGGSYIEQRKEHRFPYSPSQIEIMSRKVKKVNGLDFLVKIDRKVKSR